MALIPKTHRPAPPSTAVEDPVVAREIARAQRIVEGQNFEIRRTLWKYSALVDDQRSIVYRWRQELLRDEAAAGGWIEHAPEQYEEMAAAIGLDALRRAEQQVTVHVLDQAWAEHLALIE